uniref:Uncharacterized protein n=1 Tax=Ascaris lumbricoides TaxID=6252 RepID=A0A0M3IAF8_ASCLU
MTSVLDLIVSAQSAIGKTRFIPRKQMQLEEEEEGGEGKEEVATMDVSLIPSTCPLLESERKEALKMVGGFVEVTSHLQLESIPVRKVVKMRREVRRLDSQAALRVHKRDGIA